MKTEWQGILSKITVCSKLSGQCKSYISFMLSQVVFTSVLVDQSIID